MTGNSGKAVLGVGTATFLPGYGYESRQQAGVSLLREALHAGVRYFDTAAAYGDSEAAIGEIAAEMRDAGARICTKVSSADLRREAIEAATRESLGRLRLESVDTVLLHSVSSDVLKAPEALAAWELVLRHSLARRTGASTYGVGDARLALAAPWCDVVQVEHSILNQSVVAEIAPLKKPGQEIVARSVLCKGLLTESALEKPLASRPASRLASIAALARDLGAAISRLAIRFALDTPGVDVVLVGVATEAELREALAAAAMPPLTAEQYVAVAAFDSAAEDWTHPERWTADGAQSHPAREKGSVAR